MILDVRREVVAQMLGGWPPALVEALVAFLTDPDVPGLPSELVEALAARLAAGTLIRFDERLVSDTAGVHHQTTMTIERPS